MSEQFRYDRAEILPGSWEETREGYLRIPGTFSRTGLQSYRRADGSQVVEYRPESEVARKDALLSLANLPVTLEHPPALLTPETCREHQRGFTGSNVEYTSPFAKGFVTLTDHEAIAAVKEAKARGDSMELSVGYRVDFDPTPGVTENGERFDGVQRNIVGNHLALTRKARGGPELRLHMDSAIAVDQLDAATPTTPQEDPNVTALAAMSSATEALANALSAQIRVDAKGRKAMAEEMPEEEDMEGEEDMEEEDYEEEDMEDGETMDSAEPTYAELEQRLQQSEAAHQRDLGRLDALLDRIDAMEADLDSRQDAADIDIDALVSERIALLDQASVLTGQRETFDGMTTREVMVEALAAAGVEPDTMNGRSDDYVSAVFDTMTAAHGGGGRSDGAAALEGALGGITAAPAAGSQDASRQEMVKAAQARFKPAGAA